MAADTRKCEQCGTSFVPRREHDRFCSARCRAAWNREHAGDLVAAASALVWSVTAMADATQRLSRVAAADQPFLHFISMEAVVIAESAACAAPLTTKEAPGSDWKVAPIERSGS